MMHALLVLALFGTTASGTPIKLEATMTCIVGAVIQHSQSVEMVTNPKTGKKLAIVTEVQVVSEPVQYSTTAVRYVVCENPAIPMRVSTQTGARWWSNPEHARVGHWNNGVWITSTEPDPGYEIWHDPTLAGVKLRLYVQGTPNPVDCVATNDGRLCRDGKLFSWQELVGL